MKKEKWLFYCIVLAALQVCLFLQLPAEARHIDVASGAYEVSDIALTPGGNETELNFAWITADEGSGECVVQIAKESAGFETSAVFTGTKKMAPVDNDGDGVADYYYCHVTAAGLENQERYIYRLGDNDGSWTDAYPYATRNRNHYGFIYLADAQIGSSKPGAGEDAADALARDIAGWNDTISLIQEKFPEAAFIVSAGDQIETSGNEAQWAGFFSPAALTSIPVAAVPANHDQLWRGKLSHAFDCHFNLPNETDRLTVKSCVMDLPPRPGEACPDEHLVDLELASGDYFFTYGEALFMVLNMDSTDYDLHKTFMQAAVDANPHVKWKIAVWHYTIYTATDRKAFIDRAKMTAMVEELGVDAVLMAHDHTYCRTHPLSGGEVRDETPGSRGTPADSHGVVYFTANSASGSKYYDLSRYFTDRENYEGAETFEYVAAYHQAYVPTFSYVEVSAGSLTFTAYRTDTMEIIDTYTINKGGGPHSSRSPAR